MSELTSFEAHVITRLDDLHTIAVESKTKLEGLEGPEGRITKLERKVDKAETRAWILTLVAPILVGFHATLRHFGIKV